MQQSILLSQDRHSLKRGRLIPPNRSPTYFIQLIHFVRLCSASWSLTVLLHECSVAELPCWLEDLLGLP